MLLCVGHRMCPCVQHKNFPECRGLPGGLECEVSSELQIRCCFALAEDIIWKKSGVQVAQGLGLMVSESTNFNRCIYKTALIAKAKGSF